MPRAEITRVGGSRKDLGVLPGEHITRNLQWRSSGSFQGGYRHTYNFSPLVPSFSRQSALSAPDAGTISFVSIGFLSVPLQAMVILTLAV
jgi:hypothetical protein